MDGPLGLEYEGEVIDTVVVVDVVDIGRTGSWGGIVEGVGTVGERERLEW